MAAWQLGTSAAAALGKLPLACQNDLFGMFAFEYVCPDHSGAPRIVANTASHATGPAHT